MAKFADDASAQLGFLDRKPPKIRTPWVDVSLYATAGNGTSGSPWTGWESTISGASAAEFYFPAGYYKASSTITVPAKSRLIGAGRQLTFIQTSTTFTGPLFLLAGAQNGSTDMSVVVECMTLQNMNSGISAFTNRNCAISNRYGSYTLFRDCRFLDWWAGVILDQSEVTWTEHCDFESGGAFTFGMDFSQASPTSPSVVQGGAAGAMTVVYAIVPVKANGNCGLPVFVATTTSTTNLNGLDFNTISWTAAAGAATYDVYRCGGGGTLTYNAALPLGKIGNTAGTSLNDLGESFSPADQTNPYPPTRPRGIWTVQDAEYVIGDHTGFENANWVRACNFNTGTNSVGVAFDGGYEFALRDSQFNGGYQHIVYAGSVIGVIDGCYFEGASQESIRADYLTYDDRIAAGGGADLTLRDNFISGGTNGCVNIQSATIGAITFDHNYLSGTGPLVIGCANAARIVDLGNNTTSAQMYDNAATTTLFTPVTKYKTADQSVASSTTLANDSHLTFPIGKNEVWTATFSLSVGAALATTGVKVAVTTPTGAAQEITAAAVGDANFASGAFQRTTTSGTALDFTTTMAGSAVVARVEVCITVINGSTAGNVTLQFAQSTSDVTAVTLRKGSYVQAMRVQ